MPPPPKKPLAQPHPPTLIVSIINNPKPKPLNAITPIQPPEAAERTARQLSMCAELADLAMQLARVAAARALANWAEPEESPPAAEPQFAQSAEPPFAQTAEPLSAQPAAPHPPKQIDPATHFTRLAAVVRHCIALEARLAAAGNASAPTAVRPSTRAATLIADPRRSRLREALCQVTKTHPNRVEVITEANSRLDEELLDDPDQTIDPPDILFALCDEFAIEIDFAQLPDKYLFADAELESLKTRHYQDIPTPHATSPPAA